MAAAVRKGRVYTDLDFRLIVADTLARFRLHERQRTQQAESGAARPSDKRLEN
jgi:hypothetical protein